MHRCLVPAKGGKGGRIRCPEGNRCTNCKKAKNFDFDAGHDISLDLLIECGQETETGEEDNSYLFCQSCTPEDILLEKSMDDTVEMIAASLSEVRTRYGAIFREMSRGETNSSEIARRCGLKANRTSEDVRRIQDILRHTYKC